MLDLMYLICFSVFDFEVYMVSVTCQIVYRFFFLFVLAQMCYCSSFYPLQQQYIRVVSPPVTGIEHRKIEPTTRHLFPLQDKQIKLAKKISEKKYEAIRDHAYKRLKKTQITFMDKNIDLIINSKFTGSQQTHHKKSYIIWISKRPLY